MIVQQTILKNSSSAILSIGFGSLLLLLASWVKIPFYPIPFTGHTLVLFVLTLTQKREHATGAALCYLLGASLSLPVFAGVCNPLWFLGKSAGYLIAFPLATYLISSLSKRCGPLLAIFIGQSAILTLGFLGLIPFVGVKIAFLNGVIPFIPSAILKNILAQKIARVLYDTD